MPSEISFHETHLPVFLLFAMAAGEPTRQDPSAPKVLAAQTRGDRLGFFAGGQIYSSVERGGAPILRFTELAKLSDIMIE